MDRSHIFLNLFIVISLAFIVSANDSGYKMLDYDEEFSGYPWQRVNSRYWIPRMERREDFRRPNLEKGPYAGNEMVKDKDGRYRTPKRTSTFEEFMAEHNNLRRSSGMMVIYAIPVPDRLAPSYDKLQQ